ncbi:GGDEF domain-containing protein [Paucibacter sp. TC2R-5]|uniref:GGDEF domain-containing protein n=1 Tax=Paucibacter sp. TC2R-5 TaxID=2893555 RepID=UPI0021E4DC09|nr:GGDEF domain-containing protein [Paucibacter sp. TC2R-5]MCV2358380.1 GGDEF domain-containing protein [Paucibacter sp. TC2R-5]
MPPFDANTLSLVTAVVNGFMALVWLVMVRSFRIAPAASRLLSAAYFLFIPSLLCLQCQSWWPSAFGIWPQSFCSLAGFALMSLGVRRLMRLRQHWGDVAVITGAAALLMLSGAGAGPNLPALVLATALLSLLCARDIWSGGRALQAAWLTALLALPFSLTGLLLLARTASLWWLAGAEGFFMQGNADRATLAWLYLLMTLMIALGLVSIVVMRLIARIHYMTLRDPLTDALNRRAFGAELQTLQAQVERGHQHSLVMLDVDHFKRINDRLGHAAGDAALLHLVAVLQANMRELDRLGRLGGEEFCLLLPHTSQQDASRVAQRICEALRQQGLLWQGASVPLTASFGVVACQPGDPQGDSTLAMADWLVYRAKSAGRDRICVADPDMMLGRMVTPA